MPVGAGLDGGGAASGAVVRQNVAVDGAQADHGFGAIEAFLITFGARDDGAVVVTEAQRPDADEARVQAYGRDDAKLRHVELSSAASSRRWRVMM